MIKIAALADLHLGKKSTQAPPNFPASTKHALEKVVNYCIREKIDILLMVGDIVDRENKLFEAYDPLKIALQKLTDNNTSCFIVGGNHDFDTLPNILKTVENSNHIFLGEKGIWKSYVYEKENEQIQIIGWSFPTEHYLQSPFTNYDKSILNPNLPSIGMVHGDYFDKSSQYAPLKLSDFTGTGINTWILGHIHKPEVLENQPLILYPGSPQALSPKEKGEHGIVTFELRGTSFTEPQFVQISDILYTDIEVHIPYEKIGENLQSELTSSLEQKLEGLKSKHGMRRYIADVEMTGFTSDYKQLKNILNNFDKDGLTIGELTVRKLSAEQLRTVDYDLDELSNQSDMIGNLSRIILSIGIDDNDISQELMIKVEKEAEEMLSKNAYTRLNVEKAVLDEEELKSLVKKEASIILSHFMDQLKEQDNG